LREALIEHGIGEVRALLLRDGVADGIRIEREGVRAGDVWDAPLIRRDGSAGYVRLGLEDALIDPCPPFIAEGGAVRISVRREAIVERARPKPARAEALTDPAGTPGKLRAGPDLMERIAAEGWTPRPAPPVGVDALEAEGWSDLIAEAESGVVAFTGGSLRIERTAAFLVIDVDGTLPPGQLAMNAARAVAHAIHRFDLGGNIVVDFPSLPDRAARTSVAEAFDAAAPAPFERTAINGFGLMQVVRPLERASVIDLVQGDPAATEALGLLRRAEREAGPGTRVIAASRAAAAWLVPREALLRELERRSGARARVEVRAEGATSGVHVER